MTFDGMFVPRPPSAFHDDSWRKTRAQPTHEAIQQQVLTFLRDRVVAAPDRAFVDRHVEGEYAIVKRGQIIAYVDAIEILSVNLFRTVSLFEVKPVIDTVFGIVRQAKALLQLAQTTIPGEAYYCHVVVPWTDPKIEELKAEWPRTWAWGIKFDQCAGDAE